MLIGLTRFTGQFLEIPSPVRYAGMALVVGGLAVAVLPAARIASWVVSSGCRRR